MNNHTNIVGWGVDLQKENRPGVPEEASPPHPFGAPSWKEPAPQESPAKDVLIGASRRLTPVYSTANPPRGLSGVMRRAAYKIPDYRPGRWMLLLLADRVDVIEHNIVPLAATIGVIAFGAAAIRAIARR